MQWLKGFVARLNVRNLQENETSMSTNQTLLEQLQITGFEIARRKELLNFDSNDVKMLTSCAELVRNHIDEIVDDFYETQTSVEEMALLIGDADTFKRLHSAQRGYILSLFDGYYDMDYANNRLRIGVVHKRIGVEPKLYLSSVKTLKDTISGALQRLIQDQAHHALVYDALDKLMYFDTMLVFDTYIRGLLTEVESAENKVVNYARELEVKNVSLSIGVAHTGPEEFLESEALLSAADSMMYLAKATVNRH